MLMGQANLEVALAASNHLTDTAVVLCLAVGRSMVLVGHTGYFFTVDTNAIAHSSVGSHRSMWEQKLQYGGGVWEYM